jgi:hypothetical protein
VEADIDRAKKDSTYQSAYKWANMTPPKDASPEMKNRIAAAKTQLEKFEADFEARREKARKGQDTSTASAPGAKPTPAAPGGKLVQNKDGSFTYAPQ